MPKLLYSDGKELLPNQKSNKLKEDMELEIEEIEADKTSSNIVKLRVAIKNSKELKITKLYIDDMDTKIDTIITKEGKTYLNITAEIITNEISYNTFDKYSQPLFASIRIIAY